jgi:hypothetical protein
LRAVFEGKGDLNIRCGDRVCASVVPFVSGAATNATGDLIPENRVAPRLLSLLKSWRTSPTGDPLGVLVSFDVELLGLRDKDVLVRWSIWKTSGGQPLFGPWLSRNVAYRLKASAEEDATTQDIWVPLPKSGGSYFVRLILTADGNNLASGRTRTFS